MKKFLTLIDGKNNLFYFKNVFKLFKWEWLEDIKAEDGCTTLFVGGLKTNGGIVVTGCLRID